MSFQGGEKAEMSRTYSVVIIGLRPSFFRFLLIAAAAAAAVTAGVAVDGAAAPDEALLLAVVLPPLPFVVPWLVGVVVVVDPGTVTGVTVGTWAGCVWKPAWLCCIVGKVIRSCCCIGCFMCTRSRSLSQASALPLVMVAGEPLLVTSILESCGTR